jgi:glycosyltransferase involved in cell wall biosynthesis
VIAADVPGLSELVDDYRCGFTYAADDAGALAVLLRDLYEKRELLDEVRGSLVLPPSLEEEAFRIESIYLELLSARAGGAGIG